MTDHALILRVLFISSGGLCIAQALEHDIAAQGRSIDEAKHAFERTFLGQVLFDRQRGRTPVTHLPPAPPRYWHAWHEAAEQQRQLGGEAIETLDPDTPPAFMLQAFSDTPVDTAN